MFEFVCVYAKKNDLEGAYYPSL